MRKSFTRLFGFLLLSIMMLFSSGLYAQGSQSTVALYAGSVDGCYNVSNSYTAKISVKDFIAIKSFSLVLKYDATKFVYKQITGVSADLGANPSVTFPSTGKVMFTWSSATPVTIGTNIKTDIFGVEFGVVGAPFNAGTNSFASGLTWDSYAFYYAPVGGGSDVIRTTTATDGSLNVSVTYPTVQYTATAASCNGGSGIITITSPVGAGLNYYFNGSTTPSATPVATAAAPSINSVRVIDANGCQSHLFDNLAVSAPSALSYSVSPEAPRCFGDQGEIQFTVTGGTGPYTYWVVPAAKWAQVDADLNSTLGATTSSIFDAYKNTNFQVLKPSDTYYVSVSDANGCIDLRDNSKWQTVTVNPAPAAITYATALTSVTCNGGNDGAISLSGVTNGSGTYTASIDNINWKTVAAGSCAFTGLTAGTYTVRVKDNTGCTVSSTAIVTQPNAITFTTSYTDVACGGSTGTISVDNVSGGNGSYQFVVAAAGSAMPTTGWQTVSGKTTWATGLAFGYYSIWVKDGNGCTKAFANSDGSGNVLAIQVPGALTFTTNADNAAAQEVSCNGDKFTLTASAAGGKAPYSYSFAGGAGSSTASYTTAALTADVNVVVAVTDANNCSVSRPVTINVPTALVLTSGSVIAPTCPSGNDGRVTVTAATTGTSPYTYSTDNTIWYSNNILAIPYGTTNLYVKDSRGCTANNSVTVTPIAANSITATPTNVNCYGTQTGIITVTPTWQSGRTLQYFVASSSDAVYTTGSVFTSGTTLFNAGTYYVGARDQYGCTATVQKVVISQNANLALTVAATNATCYGLNNGTLTINTTGGYGKPQYALVNNLLAASGLTPADFQDVQTYNATTLVGQQIVQAQRGTYYVVLRDLCHNTASTQLVSAVQTIDGFKAITFTGTVVKTDITCNNSNDGTITVPLAKVAGGKPEFDGAGSYTFTLTGGSLTTGIVNATGAFTGLAAGTYAIAISDASSCANTTTIPNITIVNPAAVTISAVTVTHFTCKSSRNGVISVTATGGTVPTTGTGYWLAVNASVNGLGTDIKASDWIPFANATTTSYVATEAKAHKLFVKDANGCIGGPVNVTVLEPAILTTTATTSDVSCNGSSTGTVTLGASGGWDQVAGFTQNYSYTVGTTSNSTGSFTLAAGSYTASVLATNAPSSTSTTIGSTQVNYVYPTPATSCTYAKTFAIGQPTVFSYQATVTNVKCKDGSDGTLKVTVLSGKAANTAGEYYVQLTSTVNPTIVYTASAWKLTSGKSYTFTGLATGIYSVWISNTYDNSGCTIPSGDQAIPADGIWTKSASWKIFEPATALTVSTTWNNDITCFGGNDGKFTVTAAGGSGSYQYAAKISTISGGHILTPDPVTADWQTSNVFTKSVGTYVVWASDANGCIVGGEGTITNPVAAWRVVVRQPDQVNFTSAITTPVSCFGSATGKLTVTPTVSAGQPYTYALTGLDYAGNAVNITGTSTVANPVITGIPANITIGSTATNVYSLTLTDKNGCSNTLNVGQFVQNAQLSVDIVKANGAFLCPGDNNGVIEAVATGGSSSKLYALYRDDVLYTDYQAIPRFIVEVGHKFTVKVKDGSNCVAEDSETILAPVGVTASLKEVTCYSDTKATAVITATGDAGRTFLVRYKVVTGNVGGVESYGTPSAWLPFASANETTISNLTFADNLNAAEGLYVFEVKDNQGCVATVIRKAFVPVQHPLQASLTQTDLTASVNISGGISPYSYQVGTNPVVQLASDGASFQTVALKAGDNVITITDAHGCYTTKTVTVAPISVTAVPASGTNQANSFNVVLTFNRLVTIAAGDITGGTYTPGTASTFTVAMTGADKATLNLVLGTGIKDAAGNTFAGASFPFTIGDHAIPTVTVTAPAAPCS